MTNSCNRKGVDAGFHKEFLASAVESGLTAVVSSFTLLRVLVVCECWSFYLSVRIAEIELCIAKPPAPLLCNTSVKSVTQHNTTSVFSEICCFHFLPCSCSTALLGAIASLWFGGFIWSKIKVQ